MRWPSSVLLFASGCVGMTQRFVKLDDRFEPQPRPQAQFIAGAEEMSELPPLRFVGVLEVKGKETERLSLFVDRVTRAGAQAGCDAVVQRDAFQDGFRIQRHDMMGRDFYRNDLAIWQFLCGVSGATEEEQSRTLKQAVALAVEMRADELGSYEPCAPYTPTGSRIRKSRVCTDDPGHHSQPDALSSER